MLYVESTSDWIRSYTITWINTWRVTCSKTTTILLARPRSAIASIITYSFVEKSTTTVCNSNHVGRISSSTTHKIPRNIRKSLWDKGSNRTTSILWKILLTCLRELLYLTYRKYYLNVTSPHNSQNNHFHSLAIFRSKKCSNSLRNTYHLYHTFHEIMYLKTL